MMAIDRLVALSLGELSPEETDASEEHILSCGDCAARLERLLQIARVVPELVQRGRVFFPASTQLFDQLVQAKLITRVYELHPETLHACTVALDDIYTGVRFHVDLTSVERVDLVREAELPPTAQRTEDVPLDRERGLVHTVLRSDDLRTQASGWRRIRLLAIDAGGEREIARYNLQHTAFQR